MYMRTTVNPLMVGFMTPRTPEVITEETNQFIYDPKTQTTFYIHMGGKSGASRSNDGYKETKKKTEWGYHSENDAERYTDD